ncbi:MAG: hypothetical protein ACI8ZN_002634 [Bacteroidia bacterium]|jgi:hypothetical protein
MGSNPINLALRFLLELVALTSAGVWGWKHGNGWWKYALAFGIPVLMAVLWATFAVPNDPSRSGAAPIPTNGIIRLILELIFFAFATWVLFDTEHEILAKVFGIITIVHYLVSYDRIQWLISN